MCSLDFLITSVVGMVGKSMATRTIWEKGIGTLKADRGGIKVQTVL
jgi:hypothetical protein